MLRIVYNFVSHAERFSSLISFAAAATFWIMSKRPAENAVPPLPFRHFVLFLRGEVQLFIGFCSPLLILDRGHRKKRVRRFRMFCSADVGS